MGFFYIIIGMSGLALGSFLNSFLWRMQKNFSVSSWRSVCIHCRRRLTWWENIPVVSFVWLSGKCRTCSQPIPWHYPVVEIAGAVSFLLVLITHAYNHSLDFRFILDLFFTFILLGIFVYDGLYKFIPMGLVWLGSVVGLVANIFLIHHSWSSLLFASLIGGGFFGLQFLVSRGKWIGEGDIYLGVMMGVWLGFPKILCALLIAYVIGTMAGVTLLLSKRKKFKSQISLGNFLAVGIFVSLLWGERVIRWYLSLF